MSNRGWDERTNISYRTRESPPRYTVRQYRYPRDSEERLSVFESDRSRHGSATETRIVRRESNSPPRQERAERDIRIERYERQSPPRRRKDDDFQLDRYTKTTEYFPPRPPPEDDYQVIRRSEVFDDRVARREPSPPEDDYYYARRVREVEEDEKSEPERRKHRHRRRRSHDRDYSSDDDMVYVRRETTEGRSTSPRHRRHLAEGALVGVGAAELMRHHRSKAGSEQGTTGGRLVKDGGAAAAGAIGAEALGRARSAYRSKSRRRGSSADDYDREGRHRRRGWLRQAQE